MRPRNPAHTVMTHKHRTQFHQYYGWPSSSTSSIIFSSLLSMFTLGSQKIGLHSFMFKDYYCKFLCSYVESSLVQKINDGQNCHFDKRDSIDKRYTARSLRSKNLVIFMTHDETYYGISRYFLQSRSVFWCIQTREGGESVTDAAAEGFNLRM